MVMKKQTHVLIVTLLMSLAFSHIVLAQEQVNSSYTPLASFGNNPGELEGFYFNPLENESSTDSLVVLLHGCVQSGVELAKNSGLTALAMKNKFAVLVPQQSYKNNVKRCFNWFSDHDTQLNNGEILSIKNMIMATKQQLGIKQVYIIGLSAGGAMASAALINYPELFHSGAVIAGLPFPCANNLTKAISCMKSGPSQSIDELVNSAKKMHPINTQWPSLIVWTGDNDKIVNPNNSKMLASQWVELTHSDSPPQVSELPGYSLTQWNNKKNHPMIKLFNISGTGHGISVNPHIKNGGVEGAFLLKSPISSVLEIINTWGI